VAELVGAEPAGVHEYVIPDVPEPPATVAVGNEHVIVCVPATTMLGTVTFEVTATIAVLVQALVGFVIVNV
jgi:hypothetical protein